ncbi:MAG: leucine-rich repeat protein [Treponema sp.]|nr:leucine-rich repeat protein [Candidatus Treponema merdequi]
MKQKNALLKRVKILNAVLIAALSAVIAGCAPAASGGDGNGIPGAGDSFEVFYSLTFELNGGNFLEGETAPEKYSAKNRPALPQVVRDGFVFGGWYTSGDFTDESKITEISAGQTGDLELFAKWISNTGISILGASGSEAKITWKEDENENIILTAGLDKESNNFDCDWYVGGELNEEKSNVLTVAKADWKNKFLFICVQLFTEDGLVYSNNVEIDRKAPGIPVVYGLDINSKHEDSTVDVSFSWNNPADKDFAGIKIELLDKDKNVLDSKDVKVSEMAKLGGSTSFKINKTDLENTEYDLDKINEIIKIKGISVNVSSYDAANNISSPAGICVLSTSYFNLDDPDHIFEIYQAFAGNIDKEYSEKDLMVALKNSVGTAYIDCLNSEDGKIITAWSMGGLFKITLGEGIEEIGTEFTSEINIQSLDARYVKTIDKQAFENLNLSDINLEKIESIGEEAFRNNPFTSLTIPETCKEIGESAFENCKNLSSVEIKGVCNIKSEAFYGTNLKQVTLCHGCTVSDDAFPKDCVINYKDSNFKSKDGKVSVSVKNNPEKSGTFMLDITGDGALEFENGVSPWVGIADKIIKVTIGEGITAIGNSALSGTAITEITLPDSLIKIDQNAFKDCANLAKVENSVNVKYVYDGAFSGTKLCEYELSSHFIFFGGEIHFLGEPYQEGINPFPLKLNESNTFPEGCKLYWCEDLSNEFYAKRIFIREEYVDYEICGTGVLGDGKDLFKSDNVIRNLKITDGCTLINENYFINVEFIEGSVEGSVIIPSSVEEIGDFAFIDKENLKTVTIEDVSKLTKIGKNSFKGTGITEITLPENCTYIKNGENASFDAGVTVIGGNPITE